MYLRDWAIAQGVHPHTAYKWFHDGTLPVPAVRVGPRTILVNVDADPSTSKTNNTALYARVLSSDQKADLDSQVARLATYAANNDLKVSTVVTEVGSSVDGKRAKLTKLLADPTIGTIVVEHRDRLGRMNTELVEAALRSTGRKIVIVDSSELNDDLVEDMVAVLTSFCARLYGKRGAKNRALKAAAAAQGDTTVGASL